MTKTQEASEKMSRLSKLYCELDERRQVFVAARLLGMIDGALSFCPPKQFVEIADMVERAMHGMATAEQQQAGVTGNPGVVL